MQPTFVIVFGLGALILGVLILFISIRQFRGTEETQRLEEFVAKESSRSRSAARALSIQTRGLTGSLVNRLIVPWLKGIGRLFGRLTPTGSIMELERKLTIAGNPLNLGAREFYGIQLALLLLGAIVGVLTLTVRGIQYRTLVALCPVGLGYLVPKTWLNSRVKARQQKIRRGLPDALDMLSVCASAGLGFDQSLQRVSEYWETPIGAEFGRVISEMEMGLSRRDALRNLADRLDITELSSFVAFVLQTEQLGTSIVDTMHAQADQMRVDRRYRAQEQAQKIPTKMIIPMVFLIFPALLAIIIGPVIPLLYNFLQSLGQ
jgi:tight adherence protein C